MPRPHTLSRFLLASILAVIGSLPARCTAQIIVERIISLEDPRFIPETAQLVAGRDGRIYVGCTGKSGFCLSCKPDGTEKRGLPLAEDRAFAAVSADGSYCVSYRHFGHTALFFDRDGEKLG